MNKYVIIAIVLVSMIALSYLLKAAVVVVIIGVLIIATVTFLKKESKEPIKEGLTLSSAKKGDTAVLYITVLPPTSQERIQIHVHGHKLTEQNEPIRPSFYYDHMEAFECDAGKPVRFTQNIDTKAQHYKIQEGDRIMIHVYTHMNGVEYKDFATFDLN
jgi:hypothetical protein